MRNLSPIVLFDWILLPADKALDTGIRIDEAVDNFPALRVAVFKVEPRDLLLRCSRRIAGADDATQACQDAYHENRSMHLLACSRLSFHHAVADRTLIPSGQGSVEFLLPAA